MANTYQLIEAQTLGTTTASVTFSSILGTYTDLLIKITARSDGAFANMLMQFNGVTSGYSWRSLRGNGSSTSSSNSGSDQGIYLGDFDASGDTASTFGNGEVYIPNYSSSNYKSVSVDSVSENNATTAYTHFVAGLFPNTAAITSITFFSGTGSLVSGCSFYLYGIKNS